jgi:demethylmenaquinone methyltransferase/2-methoxy-6-polyprenyl-1,4-benzoquinol methylase
MNTITKYIKAEYFNSLAEGWDERVGNNHERAQKIKDIFSMIDLNPGDKVLDVGCGNGVLLRFIEEKITESGRITAIDPAQAMINRAIKLYGKYSNIEYVTGFIEDAILPRQFVAVICYAVLPHVDDIKTALLKIHGLIKKSGKLYIFHPAATDELNEFHSTLNAPVRHDMLPGESELRKLLSDAGFTVKVYIDEPGLNFVECLK